MARTSEEDVNYNQNSIKINNLNENNNNISHESEDNSTSDAINNNNVEDVDMEKTSSTNKSTSSLNQSSDANHTKNSTTNQITKDTKILFVEVKSIGTVGRQPESMQTAFTSLKSYKFSPNWIKEEEVLEEGWNENPDNLLFILDSFNSKVFDYLWSKKLRIIGPLAVLYCYSKSCPKNFRTIPMKPFPVYSQSMRKLFISISGFDGLKKQEMITKIMRMCGNFCKDFTKNVTHLVTESVRTKKYKVANERKVPVLSPLWIDECWTDGQHHLVNASDKPFVDKYRLKIFSKLLITVSQVEVQERKNIQQMVVENGGQYSPSLKLNEPNSVLLLRTPEGEKFKYAHMKGVPCLDVKWLYDSKEKGYALPEDDYVIRPMSQNSQKSSQNRPKPSNENQINAIPVTNCSQTADNTFSEKRTDNTNTSKDNSSQEIIERINRLVACKSDEPFLEGCDVFIVGFNRRVFESIKSALILNGSMVYNEFKNLITHVIVGPNCVDTDLEQYFDNKSCKLVSIEWLLQCLSRNECCDCNPFEIKIAKSTQISSNGSQNKKNKPKSIFEGPLTVVCPKKTHKAVEKWKEESKMDTKLNHKSLGDGKNDKNNIQFNDEESEDMPSQRPYGSDENNQHISQTNTSHLASESDKGSDDKSDDKTEMIEIIDIEEKSQDSKDSTPEKVFLFSGYNNDVKNELTKIVEELNGKVVESNNVLDCVTHLVIRDPSATEKTLSAIAAGIWVMKESYLYESKKKGHFVLEDEFEWGYDITSNSVDTKSVRKRLMISAINWRKHLKEESEKAGRRIKAFDGWDVIFLYPTRMTLPYQQVFRSANANVISLTPDFDFNRLNQIKYAFVDHKSVDDIPKYVVKMGKILTKMEKLHKIDFISHYIMNGPESDVTLYSSRTLITNRFWDSTQESQQSRKRGRDDSFEESSPHSSAKHKK